MNSFTVIVFPTSQCFVTWLVKFNYVKTVSSIVQKIIQNLKKNQLLQETGSSGMINILKALITLIKCFVYNDVNQSIMIVIIPRVSVSYS